MRLVYNAPVILTFALLAGLVLLIDMIAGGWIIPAFFSSSGFFNPFSPLFYTGIVSHILGHANWNHFISNFILILMVGPLLEEKYGSFRLLFMILVTAAATGILNAIFFSAGLMGASGIVFMMLILASFANVKRGEIPLTFLVAVALFLGQEFINSVKPDNISQFGHILGGAFGGLFGILFLPKK